VTWLIYGANGYTGELVARLAAARGERPILAGRSGERLAPLAEELDLAYRVADLRDEAALRAALEGVDVVAHCAGPYAVTARPMVAACLATRTHYVDVTGELDVFEWVYSQDAAAAEASVVLLPGAGFDVVPTDCLAARLASALPSATSLELAFLAGGGLSRGTARTGLRQAAHGGKRRVDGRLVDTALGEPSRSVPFPHGERQVGATVWGDLVTAYRSTGIPNITVYTRLPQQSWAARLLRFGPIRQAADLMVRRQLGGPSAEKRASSGCQVWGEVRDPGGNSRTAWLTGPNGYDLTADAMVRAVGYVHAGTGPAGPIRAGAHTPATALGAAFVEELDGVTVTQPSA
jgi:saccharopine dehydrogenase (NAD+, L-lysine-forming)